MSNNKEYYRGLDAGLKMALRMMRDSGNKQGHELIKEELRKRGVMKIPMSVTEKEMDRATVQIKAYLYEAFMCQVLMVLRDRFDFGEIRCKRFADGWNRKADALNDALVKWEENVQAIKDELNIDVPTKFMKIEGLL